MAKTTIPIRGMHCNSCEILIGDELKKISRVNNVQVDHKHGQAVITHKENEIPSPDAIEAAVRRAGYEVGIEGKLPWFTKNKNDRHRFLISLIIVALLYTIFKSTGLATIDPSFDAEAGLFAVAMIGLVAGFSTCMALIGGLVLGFSARHAELHPEATTGQKFRPHLFFNMGRIGGYMLFGGLIGLLGKILQLSVSTTAILTVLVGVVMILLGLKLVEIFPALKNKTIALPAGIARRLGINKEQKEYSHRSAAIAGAMTFFLPCGFTQSMQLLAIATGNFWQGAAIMGVFALGTAPGLLGVGWLSSVMKGTKAKVFFMITGIIVVLLGWYNITNGMRLLGASGDSSNSSSAGMSVIPTGEEQRVTATITKAAGFVPYTLTVNAGKPVRLEIDAQDTIYGCMSTIMIPGLVNKPQYVQKSKKIVMTFTPPKPGVYDLTCAMGIPWGTVVAQ